jgi:hypothetical protein
MHCPIASNCYLATNLHYLVVRQFEDIGDANRIPGHRSKNSFLPTRNATPTFARYDRLVTDLECYIVAIHLDTLCPAVVEHG